MQIIVDEIVSQIRAMDGDSVLSPATMTQIVQAVLAAVQEHDRHGERVAAEHSLDNHQERMSRRSHG